MRRAGALLTATILITIVLAAYSVATFRIDTDFSSMVSSELPFRRQLTAFRRAFPQLNETLVLVVESPNPEKARYARDILTERFQGYTTVFRSVFAPGGGRFYEHNGLLYLSLDELTDLMDRLAEVQPFLGLLSQELSLRHLFEVLSQVLEEDSGEIGADRIDDLLEQLNSTIEQAIDGKSDWMSWQSVMQPNLDPVAGRELILLWPHLEKTGLNPARQALAAIQAAKGEVMKAGFEDVTVRVTGDLALKIDNLKSARKGIGIAAFASSVLVSLVLTACLKSVRLLVYCLSVLFIGLIWTFGFAMAAIGRLNIISVTFVVLFIGLGIDYSIQYCLRYKELMQTGSDHADAVRRTSGEIGNALLLCMITTMIGFYAFVPTAYTGASELGLISGTGMLINFAVNMVVLPTLLHLGPPIFEKRHSTAVAPEIRTAIGHGRLSKLIVILSLLAGLAGAAAVSRIYFDFNPLNLHDPGSESVSAAKDLLKDPQTSPWTISVLAGGAEEAIETAQRLEQLRAVDRTIGIFDMTPENQDEKIDLINEMALFMPQMQGESRIASHPVDSVMAAIGSFHRELTDSAMRERYPSAPALAATLDDLLARAKRNGSVEAIVSRLEDASMMPLKLFLTRLETLTKPEFITAGDLPQPLKSLYISAGLYRVQVFPSENIDDLDAMRRFVNRVRQVAPNATGSPVGIVEAGDSVSHAFLQAFLTALAAIFLFLILVIRRIRDVLLSVLPLLAALGWTIGIMALTDLPFNFANIIAIPLLLGIGLDYSVHMTYRYRSDVSARANILRTSTARGILFSALTTLASFSSLSFSTHQGMAGMGLLLTICIVCMIGATLVLLPALLYILSSRGNM